MNQIIQKNAEQEGNAQDNYTAVAVWMEQPSGHHFAAYAL